MDTAYNYGAFEVKPCPLVHNVPNCGHKIKINDWRMIYATDTNSMEHISAIDYDLYLIECNYEDEEMMERILTKEALGEYVYEYEVLQNHLSRRKFSEFLIRNMGERSQYVEMHGHKN